MDTSLDLMFNAGLIKGTDYCPNRKINSMYPGARRADTIKPLREAASLKSNPERNDG